MDRHLLIDARCDAHNLVDEINTLLTLNFPGVVGSVQVSDMAVADAVAALEGVAKVFGLRVVPVQAPAEVA